jgi:hypothetical protein
MKTHFEDPTNLLNFTLTITPDDGKSTVCDPSGFQQTLAMYYKY